MIQQFGIVCFRPNTWSGVWCSAPPVGAHSVAVPGGGISCLAGEWWMPNCQTSSQPLSQAFWILHFQGVAIEIHLSLLHTCTARLLTRAKEGNAVFSSRGKKCKSISSDTRNVNTMSSYIYTYPHGKAIHSNRNNPNIVNKKADKGRAVVDMDKQDYTMETERQLSNIQFRTLSAMHPVVENKKELANPKKWFPGLFYDQILTDTPWDS